MLINDFDFSVLEGKRLECVKVHYVEPEFNILYLWFEDSSIYSIHGGNGSEVLLISKIDSEMVNSKMSLLFNYPDYSVFLGDIISQVRVIGGEWNGHGIEISFCTNYNETMIVQSVYAGDKPEGYDDCIRLGVCSYKYSFASRIPLFIINEEIIKWDPINLFPHAPDDEYESEIKQVFNCSKKEMTSLDLSNEIYNIFSNSFGNDVFKRSYDDCIAVSERILERSN